MRRRPGGESVWAALPDAPDVLETRFGVVWGLGCVAWLVVLAIAVPRRALAAAAVPLAALAFLPALGGHAGVQDPVAVLLPVNVLHVLAAGAWIGGIATILVAPPAATRRLEGADRAAARRDEDPRLGRRADRRRRGRGPVAAGARRGRRSDRQSSSRASPFDEQVTHVVWKGKPKRGGIIRPDQFEEFPISVRVPDGAVGHELVFTAIQTYRGGEKVRWTGGPESELPAPRVLLVAPD